MSHKDTPCKNCNNQDKSKDTCIGLTFRNDTTALVWFNCAECKSTYILKKERDEDMREWSLNRTKNL